MVKEQRPIAVCLLLLLMVYGVARPIIDGQWRQNRTVLVLTFLKAAGALLGAGYLLGLVPDVLMQVDMLPFLFDKLALPVAMIVPIGALILAFLLGFGLLEMVGVLMQPIMRPVFKTPGESAIDAVASFVGSYSVALLITNRVYLSGGYSAKEAAIIATGFSTVSTAFMVIVAKTLDLMAFWSVYFWTTMLVTFLVTAITARLPPLKTMDDNGGKADVMFGRGERLQAAWQTGINTARQSDKVGKILWQNFVDGVNMAAAIAPSILAIGLLGLLIANHTPLFDALGLLFVPFTWLIGAPEPLAAAKGISSGLVEMFLPALMLADGDLLTRFVAGVVSVSGIIFFSAMIPCMLSTKIPLSIGKMLLVWFLRVALSVLLAGVCFHLVYGLGWLVA